MSLAAGSGRADPLLLQLTLPDYPFYQNILSVQRQDAIFVDVQICLFKLQTTAQTDELPQRPEHNKAAAYLFTRSQSKKDACASRLLKTLVVLYSFYDY